MAYFAKLGTGNIVEQVISINNAVITDANGVEQEQLGNDFINKLYNTRDVWKQTSYNNNLEKITQVLVIIMTKQEMLS
jgi:DNA phosphorothioation-dependent restriction protein DptG